MSAAARTARGWLEERGLLGEDVVGARVDGVVYDLHTPLPAGARCVEPIRLSDPDALPIVRHSSAHVMADAVQRLFPGTRLAFGPATDEGFYYDYERPDGAFTEEDLARIEATMREIVAADRPFERIELDREQARALLAARGERFKLEHLERIAPPITLYRHGDWFDLCEGPHVPSTRFLRAFKLTSIAGAYWRGDERNPMLQRIYGTAFPSEAELRAHLERLEQARQRDHRRLGRELELVTFHPWAPASPFFLPRGAVLYERLIAYVREQYARRGYVEVVTPQIYDAELWRRSGHLPSYAANMYLALTAEDVDRIVERLAGRGPLAADEIRAVVADAVRAGIKPMNCPGHCLLFAARRRSYRELPLRVADFGRLHRFERSGVLHGLTRVRSFAQDDAHVFCTEEQVQDEIAAFLDFVHEVYEDFGFGPARVVLATRPDQRLGDDARWDRAEAALRAGIEARGLHYEVAEGEGAFYGPKVELHLKDALGRAWQLGTIQLDFNLPERFELEYVARGNERRRPVMLHRAVLGSIERFVGVLVEHTAGALPTWLAPEQIALLSVTEAQAEACHRMAERLRAAGVRAVADTSSEKLGAKIRAARVLRVPYLGIVGARELEQGTVSLRRRDEELGTVAFDVLLERMRAESVPPSQRGREPVSWSEPRGPSPPSRRM
ncbi:MAG: threonine--tRNA ligase [Myxococcota bacterium]|nr:threonine--tRNA ligase [Myxococcota bacterium]MDW8363673.1 threonine--tRNA ligase [Myxococcales bacterium]